MTTDAATSNRRFLHLGCGLTAPPEWVNVDGSWNARLAQRPLLRKALIALRMLPRQQAEVAWPTNIRIADLRRPLPFEDSSFFAVYSSHTLEHLYRDRAIALLREAIRVLEPGGYCRTLVPDLRTIVEEYFGRRTFNWLGEELEAELREDPARRLCARLLMHPPTEPRGNPLLRMYRAATDHHSHKWMYDGPSLVRLMTDAGFVDCRERAFLESDIPHLDKVEMPGRILEGLGVAVEGRRPQ